MNRLLREGGSWDKRTGSKGLSINNWNPGNITTALWFDAADSSTITISTGVSQWNDKSGNGRNATQATGANQPSVISAELNGRNVIRFDGTNDSLAYNGSFFVNTNYMIFMVATRRSNKSFNFIIGGSNTASNTALHMGWSANTTFTFAHIANNLDLTVAGYVSATPDLFSTWLDSSAGRRIRRNGGSQTASNTTITQLASYTSPALGAFTDGSTTYYNGDIAEMIATTSILPIQEIERIEGYLAHKWGLTGNLPASHPYKNKIP